MLMIDIKEKIIITVGLIFFIFITVIGGYIDTHYTMTAEVHSKSNNEVFLVDQAGYIWDVVNRNDLRVGSKVKIRFYNNTTENTRIDDEIVGIKVKP